MLLGVSVRPRSVGEYLACRLIPAERVRPLRYERQCLAMGAGLFRELLFGAADRGYCIRDGGPVANGGTLLSYDWNKFLLVPDAPRRRFGRPPCDDSARVTEFSSCSWSNAP